MLLSAGQESHTYEPTPSDILKIEQCDVFVCGGGESESWVDRIIDSADAELIRGKKILIVDDVISTGESLHAIEALVEKAGGEIAGRMAILAEGDAQNREDIVYLEKLPLFNAKGEIIG